MNDARQDPTTPSPRNAPPMTDRDRLEEISTAVDSALRTWAHNTGDCRSRRTVIADALLAEGVTLPPEKAGPVTSEETHRAFRDVLYAGEPHSFAGYRNLSYAAKQAERNALDAAMPLLARDHGLLTPAEVERRARVWCQGRAPLMTGDRVDALVRALTRPAPRVAGNAAPGGHDGR